MKNKLHKDGTVTIWDIYEQKWKRVEWITDEVLASFPQKEREKILKHLSRQKGETAD